MPNIGFTESATWVRFDVQNESHTIDQWLLEVAFPNIHFIDLYTPLPGGEGFAVKQTGIARPPETRDILHPHFAFNLTVPTQNQQSVYLRFKSDSSIILPITLWKPEVFFIESQWSQILYWLYFGALIGLLIYNLFLLFSLRDVNYLYLVTIIASLVIFDAAYAGYLEIYIIPQLYFLRHYYMTLSFALIFVSTVLFADIFLELKGTATKTSQGESRHIGRLGNTDAPDTVHSLLCPCQFDGPVGYSIPCSCPDCRDCYLEGRFPSRPVLHDRLVRFYFYFHPCTAGAAGSNPQYNLH